MPRAGRHPDPAGSPVGPRADAPSPGSGEYAGNGQDPADVGTVPGSRRSSRRADHAAQLRRGNVQDAAERALGRAPFVFFDNLNEADSAALAAVIASPDCRFAGRILGATRWVEVPALACWLASGNNPKVSRELARRTVVIKLDANAERPEQRSGFKIKNLLHWGIEHRVDLLYAALVLCRAWVAAGRPKGKAVLGSFESWAEVIGGILEVCGLPGFLENKNELTTRDDHALGWSALVAEWWRQYQSNLVSIDNLHEIIVRNAELEVAFSGTLGQGLDRAQKRKLGEELRRVEGRVFGSWRVEIVVGHSVRGYPLYQLLPLAAAPASTRERPGQAQPHTEPGCPAPACTREPGGDDESPRPGAACEEQSTLPF